MSIRIGLVRHGPTAWNRERRLQGRSDSPLDADGAAEVRAWRLPAVCDGWPLLSSPLARARETAEILTGTAAETDDRLIEMSFGEWEGERLSDLRDRLGAAMREREDRGRDFRAPGGESPRDVMGRLADLYREIAASGRDRLLVCHKGVIRATLAWALDWDMLGRPPVKPENGCLHLFALDAAGAPTLIKANLSLSGGTR